MTRRTIMLEGTHVPLEAECTDEGWNGFHVPILTCLQLSDYLAACQRNDPNGEYAERPWEEIVGNGQGHAFPRLCMASWQDPADPDANDVWFWSGIDQAGRYTYLIDGWVWVDYVSHDDA